MHDRFCVDKNPQIVYYDIRSHTSLFSTHKIKDTRLAEYFLKLQVLRKRIVLEYHTFFFFNLTCIKNSAKH